MDAGYYPRIVGDDAPLSRADEIHRKRRRTVRTRTGREGSEKTSADIEVLQKEILELRAQLNRTAEIVVLKDQQLIKLDTDYKALRRTERQVSQDYAREQRAHEETKGKHNGLKLLMRELGGQLWRRGC